MATFKSDAYDGRYLELTIAETVNATENTSTLKWTLKSTGGSSSYYTIGATTVIIAGTTVYEKAKTDWSEKVFPAAKGSVSGSLTVKHDSNGSKSINVSFKTRVYVWEPVEYGGSMKLTDIDRSAPSVSLSTSNVTVSGFKISATANVKCNIWEYSVDGGSNWTRFSTTDATSASVTLSNLKVNTSYSVKVRARRTYNYVYGTSSAKTVKTLGYTILNSCASFYVDASSAQVKPNVTVYDGSFTHNVVFKNGSTVLFTISSVTWSAGTSTKTLSLTTEQKNKILSAMTTVKTKNLTVVIETYNGSTLIGSSSLTVKAETSADDSSPEWVSPYISWEDSSDYVSLTGDSTVMIQGFSNLVVKAIGVSARNYAKINGYSVTIGDQTVSSTTEEIDVGVVKSSGTLSMRLTVTDSRGYSKYVTRKVTVIPYEPPNIISINLRRANGIDAAIQFSFTATISEILVDGTRNVNMATDVSYSYSSTNENDFIVGGGDITKLVDTSISGQISYETNELVSLDVDRSYYLSFDISDNVTKRTFKYLIPKGIPLIGVRKDKLGINNPEPQYTLDVAGDICVAGGLYKDGRNVIGDTGWIDLGISDSCSESDSKGGGHYLGCAYRIIGGNHVYVAFNVSTSFISDPVTVSANAIPSEYKPSKQPYAIVALNGSRVARILVSRTSGHVIIDWIRNIADATEPEEHIATWIDGYIDYWID